MYLLSFNWLTAVSVAFVIGQSGYRRIPKVTAPSENNGSPKVTLICYLHIEPESSGPHESRTLEEVARGETL